jgi:hypothetical protein
VLITPETISAIFSQTSLTNNGKKQQARGDIQRAHIKRKAPTSNLSNLSPVSSSSQEFNKNRAINARYEYENTKIRHIQQARLSIISIFTYFLKILLLTE